jgi:hypothetical protein
MKRTRARRRSRAEGLARRATRRVNEGRAGGEALSLDPDHAPEVMRPATASSVDRATFRRSEYGRIVRPDGSEQWWVRSARGTWIALSHQRVMENDDGTITLLWLT